MRYTHNLLILTLAVRWASNFSVSDGESPKLRLMLLSIGKKRRETTRVKEEEEEEEEVRRKK